MAKEPKAKEHSKKSKAKEYTKTCLEDSTERSESNPGRSLGIKAWRGGLSGRQYQRRMGVTFSLVKSEKWKVKSEKSR